MIVEGNYTSCHVCGKKRAGSQERKSDGKEKVGIPRALGGQVRDTGFSSAIIILTLFYFFIVKFIYF